MTENTCSTTHSPSNEYSVYSYNYAKSEKKGQIWRQHGTSSNLDEAKWIAEQLKSCEEIERIEIRLQKINKKTNQAQDKVVKSISNGNKKGFWSSLLS